MENMSTDIGCVELGKNQNLKTSPKKGSLYLLLTYFTANHIFDPLKVFVPEEELLTTEFENGILITNTNDTPDDDWCKSTFGIATG